MLNGLSPAPIVVLVHRGRRSGKTYRTPVEALVDDTERGEIVISPMFGEHSDWYRNVIAGGLVEVRRKGVGEQMEWRRLSGEECREAIAVYRENHPVYSRMILRMLVRIHGLAGDPVEAVLRALPMLALQPPASGR